MWIKLKVKKFPDQYLTLTIVVAITGWLCVSVNAGLWQAGGRVKVPDLMASVVCRGREGLRRRTRALHHIALLHLLLFTCFLPEEKTSQPSFPRSNLENSPMSRTDCVRVLLETGTRDLERCMACQRSSTHRSLSSAVSAAYTHTHTHITSHL